ncbi:MAG: UDP-N-acetylmuramoyl-L-alanine--D-glutamate ligase [Rubrivivax sp.]|nr:UDP-N-acetylmuramoyl-L-alanine--D-glutamate ligase [Rubrivivax sp.]
MTDASSTVLVLGLGASGLAMARWCAARGWAVRVWDSRAGTGQPPPQAAALAAELPQVPVFGGELGAEALEGVQRVLKSPGLAPGDARIAPLLRAAAEAGVPVQGELDLFVQALAALREERGYAPQLLAVTGTNGKTTTTAMCGLLVERAGRSVVVAGNIGPTMLDTLAARLAADELPQVWVLELSSYQLAGGGAPGSEGVRGFEPAAAAVLNLTQDHLDWHGTMAAYAAAKARVFGEHAVLVVNRDDAAVEALVPAPQVLKGSGKARAKTIEREVIRFGLGAPQRPGDFGLVVENGMAWLVRALPADETLKKGEQAELHLQRLMPADALRVRGRHNAANALAALALASAIGCPLAPMLHGLREYAGEPHRVQWVATVGEVDAYDDSKGTNVGATVAAIEGLGADKAPAKLLLILGGDGKGQDFAPLAEPLARHARAVATIGRDAPIVEAAVADALAAAGVPLQRHGTLPDAVDWCFAQARPGDAVLLSPACASWDMFGGYAERAAVFVQAVQALAAQRGELA